MPRLQSLTVRGLRVLDALDLDPGPGLNVFIGENGVGKTSILEALSLLSRGRSFRGGSAEVWIRHGADRLQVGASVEVGDRLHRLGLERRRQGFVARVDGEPAGGLAALARWCPVLIFEPETHELISGASEHRRSLLHWLMFHVEPVFGERWKDYQRALQQRNAALRGECSDAELEGWDDAVARSGEAVTALENAWSPQVRAAWLAAAEQLLPHLGAAEFVFDTGWEGPSLRQTLRQQRGRDRALGYTTQGPQRSDWTLSFARAARREALSRGQQKLACIGCLVGAAALYAAHHGEPPIFAIDDLFSELDQQHQRRVLDCLQTAGVQLWVTGVERTPALSSWTADRRVFHVEHGGRVTQLI
jgi:DNA replication and repair protein RecF